MPNAVIVVVAIATLAILLAPPVARARLWRATVTPLASIIGSGFLVLGPILNASFGHNAPWVMVGLCVVAYAFGSAIRFNIRSLASSSGEGEGEVAGLGQSAVEHRLDQVGSWALAFAYVVSVAYYLNLFGSFAVNLTPWAGAPVAAKSVTSAIFIVILAVGWFKGFTALERVEQFTVALKLAIIAGLLVGLTMHFAGLVDEEALIRPPPTVKGWAAVTLCFGLLVTVQGFETSRYLGDEYDATTRIRSMRLAQWISTGIYLVYILLLTWSFRVDDTHLDETAIIDMMAVVAPVLPVMLVAAALAAQFSAAVADTSGAGGLVVEISQQRAKARHAYLMLVVVGLVLTWVADVFEIISYASRSFAAYYAVESAIAAVSAWRRGRRRLRAAFFALLVLLAVAIAVFGTSVEG